MHPPNSTRIPVKHRMQQFQKTYRFHTYTSVPAYIMLSACARAQSRALNRALTAPSPATVFRNRFQSRSHAPLRMRTQNQSSSAAAAAPTDPKLDKTDALRMLKFINYAWTPYHVVGTCRHCSRDMRLLLSPIALVCVLKKALSIHPSMQKLSARSSSLLATHIFLSVKNGT